jgi:hypothetical protein
MMTLSVQAASGEKVWQSENDRQERRFMLDIEGGLALK